MANEYRISGIGVEVLDAPQGAVRISGIGVEVLDAPQGAVRISGIGVEVLRSIPSVPLQNRRRPVIVN
jgi:hypothetical protein